jgi:hypothetical protein
VKPHFRRNVVAQISFEGFTSDARFEDPPDASENTLRVIEHCKGEIKYLKTMRNKK